VNVASTLGQRVKGDTLEHMSPDSVAAKMYEDYKKEVQCLSRECPSFLKPTLKKHYFTATSPALVSHVYSQNLHGRLHSQWHTLRSQTILALPAWLWQQVYGLHVLRNEISLPPELRCDPPVALVDLNPNQKHSENQAKPGSYLFVCAIALLTFVCNYILAKESKQCDVMRGL